MSKLVAKVSKINSLDNLNIVEFDFFGKTLKIEISTIRSFPISMPVVSRSKKQIGLFSFSSIFGIYKAANINLYKRLKNTHLQQLKEKK